MTTGAAGGLLGFAAADEEDGEVILPPSFGVPPPNVGDKGLYVTYYYDDAYGAEYPPGEFFAEFEWLPDGEAKAVDGQVVMANQVLFRTNGTLGLRPDAATVLMTIDPGSGSAISTQTHVARNKTKETHGYLGPNTQNHTSAYYSSDFISASFCGLRHELQRRSLAPADTTPILGACSSHLGWWPQSLLPAALGMVGTTTKDGNKSVVFAGADSAGGNWTVWFSATNPYPLEVRYQAPNVSTVRVQKLLRLERGEAPALTLLTSSLKPIEDLPLYPRQIWGADETGFVHPFPLSAAFKAARDDPTQAVVRDFMAKHPTSYIQQAFPMTDDRSPDASPHRQETRTWVFRLTDGSSTLVVCIEQKRAGIAAPGQEPLYPAKVSFRWDCQQGNQPDATHIPKPEQLPPMLPRLADVVARWQSLRSPAFAGQNADDYWLGTYCHSRCTKLFEMYYVGVDNFDVDWTASIAGGEVADWNSSELYFNSQGKTPVLSESSYKINVDGPPRPGGELVAPAGVEAAKPAEFTVEREAPAWVAPSSGRGAAAGFVGLVLGALYWFWPQVKGFLGATLFSRLEKPAALKHPLRAQLFEAIQSNPGIHYQELVRKFSAGHGTIEHHLEKLHELGLVAVNNAGAYRCYFPAGTVDQRLMNAAAVLKSEGSRRLIRLILDRPGRSNGELARDAGITPAAVTQHIARFQHLGLVQTERHGNRSLATLTDLGQAAARAVEA